ncbi:lichenan operon transcriptional antiterminator [Gracilibacillus ureilyticus]|uniref:Lichenan operon transcriptional antiterminator n=1 Tax=Gracilibacillus ureilyticus TaxID=531814 RepID=A0A1H9QPA0_9BACI|nr:BglG family transcription antiterminator [Gracilibacillus ureilyticus]SER61573.1 lichenan operon transcriptional antiterminator [Gracilibacillus ureilyticus]
MLNSRLKTILRELMAEGGPVTSTYLANINNVTARTTRDDMKKLDDILKEYGAAIEAVMGKGYRLEIIDDNNFRQFLQSIFKYEEKNNNNLPKSPKERAAYIIKRLLLIDGYLKLEDLADELFISKSTIQNDIKEIRNTLLDYGLSLESKPNYGLRVEGNEVMLRFCIAEYVFDRKAPIPEVHLDSISQSDIEKISSIILKAIEINHITLSDIAINNLAIHIMIAYKRMNSGYQVTLVHQDMKEITEQAEYKVAKGIVQEVEQTFQVKFPEVEIAYIAIHLLGTKMLTQSSELVEQVMDQSVLDLVNIALEKVEEKLQLGIKDDKELIMALHLHLKPAINRFKFGMNIRNPMLDDIKRNYPLAFEAGIIAGLAIEEETATKIDENEVGYLALHIGSAIERRNLKTGPKRCLIVCASGLGTSQLIYYKLKSQFGQHLDVIGSTEYYQLHQYNLQEIDFIVSSIPIPKKLSVPVIEVNAILGENDISKIEELVLEEKQAIDHFIRRELTFVHHPTLDSKEAVLEYIASRLTEAGLVDEGFLEAVYEREQVAPTSFGNLVAIPHPITPKTEKTFLTICTLPKPIVWHDKPVQFVCLLCVKKNSQEDLQAMYKWLGKIIDSRTIVQQLIKAKNFDEIRRILKEYY